MLSRQGESKPHFGSPNGIYFWEAPLRGARLFVAAARLLPVCRSAPSTCVSPCDIHTFSQFLGFCCDIRRDRSDLARSSVSNVGQAAGSGAEQRKVVPNFQLPDILEFLVAVGNDQEMSELSGALKNLVVFCGATLQVCFPAAVVFCDPISKLFLSCCGGFLACH
jgi:hypothetical protein